MHILTKFVWIPVLTLLVSVVRLLEVIPVYVLTLDTATVRTDRLLPYKVDKLETHGWK